MSTPAGTREPGGTGSDQSRNNQAPSDPSHLHAEVRGAGPRLVLVHGFTQTSKCWGSIADDLARDHELVLVDAPGHGESSIVAADLWTAGDLVGEIGGHANYIGYSMGGRILLHLALQHPQLVERLVLVSATAGIDLASERAERIRSDEELARRLAQIGLQAFIDEWMAQPLFAGLEPTNAQRDERLANTVNGLTSSLLLAGTGTQEPLWNRLGTLSMPVLVVAGSLDTKFTTLAQRLVDEIGPNAELLEIPGAGHSAHLENPEEFATRLRYWLARNRSLSRWEANGETSPG